MQKKKEKMPSASIQVAGLEFGTGGRPSRRPAKGPSAAATPEVASPNQPPQRNTQGGALSVFPLAVLPRVAEL